MNKSKFNLRNATLIGLALIFLLSTVSVADVIILKNGRRITGNILGESETTITVKTVLGTISVNRSQIGQILKEEEDVTHIRNGDYYMEKGDYAAATTEYTTALRINPNLAEIAQKLSDAKSKLTQTTIDRLAPVFAEGDRYISKGYYDEAVKAYRDALKSHPEPEYVAESNRKIQEVCRALIAKGDDEVATKNYNGALEMYAKVTVYNSGDITNQSMEKVKILAASLFGEGDAYLASKDFVKASQSYQKIASSYPGNYIDTLVKDKLKEFGVQLRYHPKVDDQWRYKMTQKTILKIPIGMPNMPQGIPANMEVESSMILNNVVEKIENSEIELLASLDSVKVAMNIGGEKQNVPVPNLQQKSFSYRMSDIGKPIKPADLSGLTGDNVMGTESMFAGVGNGSLPTLPLDTVHIGDKWIEPINQKINMGTLGKMTITGRKRYTLLGFETMRRLPCAKIEEKFEDVRMTFRGNVKPAPDKPAQMINMSITMNGSGTMFFAYNEGKMMRDLTNTAMDMDMSVYSGGDSGTAPAPAPTPNLYPGPAEKGPMGPPEEMTGRRPLELAGPAPGPVTGIGPSPMQQTGKMQISGIVVSDIISTD